MTTLQAIDGRIKREAGLLLSGCSPAYVLKCRMHRRVRGWAKTKRGEK